MVESTKYNHNTSNDSGMRDEKVHEWFHGLIHSVRTDQMLFEQNAMSSEKKSLYRDLANGDKETLGKRILTEVRMDVIKDVLIEYLLELSNREVQFKELAFDLGVNRVLVWAELANNDENSEDDLILSEAKINEKFYDFGFGISSTIVFEEDQLNIPSHYQIYKEED